MLMYTLHFWQIFVRQKNTKRCLKSESKVTCVIIENFQFFRILTNSETSKTSETTEEWKLKNWLYTLCVSHMMLFLQVVCQK